MSTILPEIRVKIEILAYFQCLERKFVRKWGSILYRHSKRGSFLYRPQRKKGVYPSKPIHTLDIWEFPPGIIVKEFSI